MNIVGIYKITSPSGKVYIGKSLNIKKRIGVYKKLACKVQPKLYNSLLKYGWENHKFEIILRCSVDTPDSVLKEYEKFFIDWYKSNCIKYPIGIGLNLTDGGDGVRGGTRSDEWREKTRQRMLGNKFGVGWKWTEERRELMTTMLKGNTFNLGKTASVQTKQKMSKVRQGRVSPTKGMKHTPEQNKAKSLRQTGKKRIKRGKHIYNDLKSKTT